MNSTRKRHLLVFDTAYTYEMMVQRNLSVFVTARELGRYFDHVWTVHPVASIVLPASSALRYGAPEAWQLNPRHTLIEGKFGRFKRLAWLSGLNFLLAQIELLWHVLRLMKKNRITILRAEDPYYCGAFALMLSVLMRVPLIIGVWGNPDAIREQTKRPLVPRLFKWIWLERLVERWVLRRADIVLAGNNDNLGFVLRHGVPRERTAIIRIGNAIHASHFSPPEQREDGVADLKAIGLAEHKVLMCISRLDPSKLPDHVVHVAHCLKHRGWNIRTLFVGDGSMRDSLAALAEELGVVDQIVFCGNRDQEWLARVIPRAAVVVSPLTGRALAEAALGGAPIVAYDVDWHSELIETGVTGELVPYLDYSSMAEAVERVLIDEQYARKIGRNVRNRACELMDPRTIEQQQIGVYEKLLALSG